MNRKALEKIADACSIGEEAIRKDEREKTLRQVAEWHEGEAAKHNKLGYEAMLNECINNLQTEQSIAGCHEFSARHFRALLEKPND